MRVERKAKAIQLLPELSCDSWMPPKKHDFPLVEGFIVPGD
jgi:hypothetical protein